MKKLVGFSVNVIVLFFIFIQSNQLVFAATQAVRIVGYLPDYDYGYLEKTVDFEQLTDINYFSVIPQEDGKLKFTDSGSGAILDELVAHAHAQDVRVGISLGGWGMSQNFAAATQESTLAIFIQEIVAFVKEHHLDTVDIDWEYPDVAEADQFTAFVSGLKKALPETVALSICVPTGVGSNGNITGQWDHHFPVEGLRQADWINIMAYDAQVEGYPNHSPVELQKNSLNYWNELLGGNQMHKLVGGVPFYGKALNGAVKTYGRIMSEHSDVLVTDEVTLDEQDYYFNNKETILQKTQDTLDMGALGLMIWAPTQDMALGSSRRLLDVVLETVAANERSLDKTHFAPVAALEVAELSKRIVPALFSGGLMVVGFLLFKNRLPFILPSKLAGKQVNKRSLGQMLGGLSVLAGGFWGLSLFFPGWVLLVLVLLLLLGSVYLLRR